MMSYRGAGGGGGAGAGAGAGGGGAAAGAGAGEVRPLSGESLRRAVNLALRQIKKLRKYELEKVCRVAGVSSSGLKATLLGALERDIQTRFSMVSRSGPVSGMSQARVLTAMTQEINQGYSDVINKRPAGGQGSYHYSTMKQDGGRSPPGSSKGGGAGGSAGGRGGVRWDAEVAEDVLRRANLNPFYEVTDTLSPPTRLERANGSQDVALIRFNLEAHVYEAVRLSLSLGKSTEGGRKTHLVLRSYKLDDGSLQGPKAEAAKAAEGAHVWPLESVCQVNGTFQNLKQRKVFFQGSTRKLKGDCAPQDIGAACRQGENRVELYSSDPDQHAVLLQVVRLVGVEEVLGNIKGRSQLTKKEALRRVKRSFTGSADLNKDLGGESSEDEKVGKSTGGGGGDDDSDDDLLATATRLSLRCPLGLVPITCPGRGRNCKHLQCFDLNTFLNFNKDCAGAAWKCGVCNFPIKPADLVVDTYLDEVVRSLEQRGLTDEAEEVEIHQDGHWEPILEDQKARQGGAIAGGGGGGVVGGGAAGGWDSRATAGAAAAVARPAATTLKRPRPSGQPDDFPRQPHQPRGGSGGGGGGGSSGSSKSNGGSLTIPFLGSIFGSSSSHRDGNEPGGGAGPGTGAHWGGAAAAGGGGTGEADGVGGGWDDEVFRNLDGLGDPLGR
eukprot:g10454.t1